MAFAQFSVLNGEWTPVIQDIVLDNLLIEGAIPDDLVGALNRNTFNQRFEPLNPEHYHTFDGDGMVYSIELREGKASYRNKWVANYGAKAELAAGRGQVKCPLYSSGATVMLV